MFLFFCLSFLSLEAQEPEEEALLRMAEASQNSQVQVVYSEEIGDEDKQEWLRHGLDLNRATAEELFRLGLSVLQTQNLLDYRRVAGLLIDIHELQAVPSFNVEVIKSIKPYVSIGSLPFLSKSFREMWRGGKQLFLLYGGGNVSDFFRRPDGYEGVGGRLLATYRFQYRDRISIAFLGEKDAGEAFFRGRQRKGFDFYSGHVFMRGPGCLQSVVAGDFAVNMGQGLIHWQGMSFGKSANISLIKKYASVINPYRSAGEVNFHRGIGLSLAKGNWQLSAFFSRRALDAVLQRDSIDSSYITVRSIRNTGYHRNEPEWAGRSALHKTFTGMAFRGNRRGFSWGFNTIHSLGSLPQLAAESIKPVSFASKYYRYHSNFSFDWAFTKNNFHFFGEAAVDRSRNAAWLSGMLISLAAGAEASLLYRAMGRGYLAEQAMAFSEYSGTANEGGLFAGLSLRPFSGAQINAYADHFYNPWLRYRLSKPYQGVDYLLEGRYSVSKHTHVHFRYRKIRRGEDVEVGNGNIDRVEPVMTTSFRWGLEHPPIQDWRIRVQAEIKRVQVPGREASRGQCLLTDLVYKPLMSRLSFSMTAMFYQTDDWAGRVYVMERGLLPGSSVPALYGQGYRWQVVTKYRITENGQLGFCSGFQSGGMISGEVFFRFQKDG